MPGLDDILEDIGPGESSDKLWKNIPDGATKLTQGQLIVLHLHLLMDQIVDNIETLQKYEVFSGGPDSAGTKFIKMVKVIRDTIK